MARGRACTAGTWPRCAGRPAQDRRPRPARAARPRRCLVRAGPVAGEASGQPGRSVDSTGLQHRAGHHGAEQRGQRPGVHGGELGQRDRRSSRPRSGCRRRCCRWPRLGTPCAPRRAGRRPSPPPGRTATTARAGRLAEQGGERVLRQPDRAPGPAACRQDSARARRPGRRRTGRARRTAAWRDRRGEQRAPAAVRRRGRARRAAAQVTVRRVRPGRAAELRLGPAEQHEVAPDVAEARCRPGGARRRCTPSTPTTGVGWIAVVAGLVVEADVAAGDRHAQRGAAVGQPAHRLGELPHHRRDPPASRSSGSW